MHCLFFLVASQQMDIDILSPTPKAMAASKTTVHCLHRNRTHVNYQKRVRQPLQNLQVWLNSLGVYDSSQKAVGRTLTILRGKHTHQYSTERTVRECMNVNKLNTIVNAVVFSPL